MVIYNLPIAFKLYFTVLFPPPAISGLYAKSIAIQETEPNFLISFTPGNYYFTVRAVKREAEDHLLLSTTGKVYILRLSASDKPFYAVAFFQSASYRGTARPVVPATFAFSGSYSAIRFSRKTIRMRSPASSMLRRTQRATMTNSKLLIRDVWCFEQEDTLVFRVELENSSGDIMTSHRTLPSGWRID